jgi:hypothetical protein
VVDEAKELVSLLVGETNIYWDNPQIIPYRFRVSQLPRRIMRLLKALLELVRKPQCNSRS